MNGKAIFYYLIFTEIAVYFIRMNLKNEVLLAQKVIFIIGLIQRRHMQEIFSIGYVRMIELVKTIFMFKDKKQKAKKCWIVEIDVTGG